MSLNHGFIREKLEIKILILFILRRLPKPINIDVLTDLTMCDDGISYFDFRECVEELIKTKHIKVKDGLYSITNKGEHNGSVTENSLPFSIRLSAENSASAIRTAQMRDAMINTHHAVKPDGSYSVTMSLSDGVGDILKIELYASNEKQAKDLEKGFRKKAELVYNNIIESILHN